MELLVIILNHEDHFYSLIPLLQERGIHGGTILDSEGLASTLLQETDDSRFKSLRAMLNQGRPYNKTILLVLKEEMVDVAKECVREVVGDISHENTGVLFTLPVSSFEGLTK